MTGDWTASNGEQALSAARRAWYWAASRLHLRLADAHRHFGNLYGSQREHWAAIEHYTRATTLDPAYAQAYFSRGVLYWREVGNCRRAIQDLTRVLELAPCRAEAWFNRGLAYELCGEAPAAIADFERYLAEGTDEFWLESARRQLAALRDESEGHSTNGAQTIG
jgi:tetratricopeptide (TPR) repeat protein